MSNLYWHYDVCGDHEIAQPEYEHGDTEPCLCGNGVARIMTLQEAVALESAIAQGQHVPKTAYTDGHGRKHK